MISHEQWFHNRQKQKYPKHCGKVKYNIQSGYSDFFSNIKYCKNKNIDIFPVHIFVKQNTFFWSYYQVLRITFYPDIWTVKNHSPLWDPIAGPTARYSDNSVLRQLYRPTALQARIQKFLKGWGGWGGKFWKKNVCWYTYQRAYT